ncbi:MAG: hypothetical protein HZT40_11945 [Candidatus Thiothrix singaporensis]|uniref:Uncharacterized protein n=1 Tax=Candidatus Thiothrix singaporensis TaxID=2799669 RepID=A0A7L6ASS0_9GAMM|nr:MAG: hypothetical protein HZT40_11945 [Candidatus Thiothrix singaporensis]
MPCGLLQQLKATLGVGNTLFAIKQAACCGKLFGWAGKGALSVSWVELLALAVAADSGDEAVFVSSAWANVGDASERNRLIAIVRPGEVNNVPLNMVKAPEKLELNQLLDLYNKIIDQRVYK